MSVRPNKYGPFCPCGEITIDAAGTSKTLDTNFEIGYVADPNVVVSASDKQQYAIAFEDVIINSPPSNAGGLYVVTKGGSKDTVDTILLYIPKSSPPISIKRFLGGSRFNPSSMAVDADQNGDKVWVTGVIGS